MSDKEIFFKWAESIGRHKSGDETTLDELPRAIERMKIRELKSQFARHSMRLEALESKNKDLGGASATKMPRFADENRLTKRQDQHEAQIEKLANGLTLLTENFNNFKD